MSSRLLKTFAGALLLASAGSLPAQQPTPGRVEQMSIPVEKPRLSPVLPFPTTPQKRAPGRIWSAVILASNVSKPKAMPAELRPIASRLQRVVGYNQFEIVGRDEAPIEDGAERKLTPCRAFWIDLKARQASVKEARGVAHPRCPASGSRSGRR